jgi:hypothetical protein
MPSWSNILQEVQGSRLPNGALDLDGVRRAKYRALAAHTGRPLLIYASDFFNQGKIVGSGGEVNLDFRDKNGFEECTHNIPGPNLDVLLHSPGGLAEAAESIVKLLRTKYTDIRFIIPSMAKSAATMLALSGNSLVMNELSELGPTDPQFSMQRADGTQIQAPAQAIIDQFDAAQKQLSADAKLLPAWIPILPIYGPALYQQCKNAIKLSERLVKEWLATYMFANKPRRKALKSAQKVAYFFANHNNFLTHARRVDVDQMIALGATVHDLRKDPTTRKLIQDVYAAIIITFDSSGAFKLIENSAGDAYVRMVAMPQLAFPGAPGMIITPQPHAPAPSTPPAPAPSAPPVPAPSAPPVPAPPQNPKPRQG